MTRRLPDTWAFENADAFRAYVLTRPLVRRTLWRAAAVIEREMRDLSRDEITPHTVRVHADEDGVTVLVDTRLARDDAKAVNRRIESVLGDVLQGRRSYEVGIAVKWA